MVNEHLIKIEAVYEIKNVNSITYKNFVGYRIYCDMSVCNPYHLRTLKNHHLDQYQIKLAVILDCVKSWLEDLGYQIRTYLCLDVHNCNVDTLNCVTFDLAPVLLDRSRLTACNNQIETPIMYLKPSFQHSQYGGLY